MNRAAAGKAEPFITTDKRTLAEIEAALGAPERTPVLVLSAPGADKAGLARLLHERSGRKGAFEAFNCAAYAGVRLEGELFGSRKASAPGVPAGPGKFLKASGGTLFIQEAGALADALLVKLLKAFHKKEFYPLGSRTPVPADPAVILCVNSGPETPRSGFFRRMNWPAITLKPLTEHKRDIPRLIRRFTPTGRRLAFSEKAEELLLNYSWPGDTRELKRLVELLCCSEDSKGVISAEALNRHLTWHFF
jgi:transcriptional regulator with AAA-type ATPase domain